MFHSVSLFSQAPLARGSRALPSVLFDTVAEGAEGPSSGFEVIGRELAELDEGRSQEAMDNFFA